MTTQIRIICRPANEAFRFDAWAHLWKDGEHAGRTPFMDSEMAATALITMRDFIGFCRALHPGAEFEFVHDGSWNSEDARRFEDAFTACCINA